MARLTSEQWKLVRAEYEASNISFGQLADKHGIHKSNISKRAKKEDWAKGKTQHLVDKKVSAIMSLHETQQQTRHLNATVQMAIDCEVTKRLEAEAVFVDAAKYNQLLANEVLQNLASEQNEEDTLKLSDLDTHSKITAKNKETVLGKQPDTQVNVQTNIETKPISTIFEQ